MVNADAAPLLSPRVRLVDEVVEVLRSRIYDGTYAAGSRLRQELIASELGISRTPLREAFKMLEQDGLIVVRAGRGAEVVSGDLDTLIDAYRVREVIDGLAARMVAESHDDRALELLQQVIDKQRLTLEPWDPKTYVPLNVKFHGTILELSRNEYLTAQTSVLHMTANVFVPWRVLDVDRVRNAVDEHQTILDAIKRSDPDEAERAARAHIAITIDTLQERRASEGG